MNGEGSYIAKSRERDPYHRSGSKEKTKAILFRGHYDHNEFQQQQEEDEQQDGDILV